MANTAWSGVRANVIYDAAKEAAKMMLPFLTGLGVAHWVTEHAVGLTWAGALAVAALIAFWDHWPRFGKSKTLTIGQTTLIQDANNQLAKINRFQGYALSRLLLTAGMTENQFSQEVSDIGFPIGSLFNHRVVESTFSDISSATTFVENDPHTGAWRIRDRYRFPLEFLLKQRGPLIG